ncbi:DUF5711 family protein [Tindallia californiensis]|uniref:Uncharacterized protein n=1 Tax=Tindallia californiensis TaxID=159292 RepID=A0A1H3QK66_9FIRM|nr:DUF5711 family protein [Tindallia californiensis]SDZ13418.1 hypothetical protein SAMN05192546_109124 [Tindallia californiensis]
MKVKRKFRKRLFGFMLIVFVMLLLSSPWTIRYLQRHILAGDQEMFLYREVAIPYSGNWEILSFSEGIMLLRNAEIRYFHGESQYDWTLGTENMDHVAAQNKERVSILEKSPRYLLSMNEEGHMLYQQAVNRPIQWMISDQDHHLLAQHPEEDGLVAFSVFDPQGRVMGSMILPDAHLLSSSLDSSRDRVLLSFLEVGTDGYESVLTMYDLHGVLVSSWSFPRQLIFGLAQEGRNLSILMDDQLQVMTKEREVVAEQPIDPFYLKSHNGEAWILVHRQEEEMQSRLRYLSADGKDSREKEIAMNISGMDVNASSILVYNARELKVFNNRLDLIAEHQLSRDIEKGFVLENNLIVLQTRGELLFYEMR